jgi:hypothetical protein
LQRDHNVEITLEQVGEEQVGEAARRIEVTIR